MERARKPTQRTLQGTSNERSATISWRDVEWFQLSDNTHKVCVNGIELNMAARKR